MLVLLRGEPYGTPTVVHRQRFENAPSSRSKSSRGKNPRVERFGDLPSSRGNSPLENKDLLRSSPRNSRFLLDALSVFVNIDKHVRCRSPLLDGTSIPLGSLL